MAIIVIANQKGGVTKSTTARNLAIGMKADILIDQDKNQNNVRWFNGLRDKEKNNCKIKIESALGNKEQLAKLLQQDGLIIVDCGGADTDVSRTALAYADLVVCPCSNDFDAISTTLRFHRTIQDIEEKANIKINVKLLKALEMPTRKNFNFIDEFIEFTQWPMFTATRARRECYKKASNNGQGISEYKSASIAAQNEAQALIKEIQLDLQEIDDE
jgi:chromosome partitioning protein